MIYVGHTRDCKSDNEIKAYSTQFTQQCIHQYLLKGQYIHMISDNGGQVVLSRFINNVDGAIIDIKVNRYKSL